MPTFAVLYDYTDDTEGRDQHRAAHREYLATLVDSRELIASGPTFEGERAGALLIMDVPSAERAAELLDADPFQLEGLVGSRRILEYSVVLGSLR
ncbi:YciI family protein [Salinibacterium sp. SYSU T00001]|uniref:YciI family protein n=1 Tax=Homoserinimonas sedimenticola TaxID=2986805 RepID=UPI002235ADB4|nr:YciI family protein [Salinibacterium sedimenticola]MCW4385839.1 YciI family protein [Salinibacterium sedimenticola]